jgi:hypothetical protein
VLSPSRKTLRHKEPARQKIHSLDSFRLRRIAGKTMRPVTGAFRANACYRQNSRIQPFKKPQKKWKKSLPGFGKFNKRGKVG